MKHALHTLAAALIGLAAITAGPVAHAQQVAATANAALTEGEIKKVDKATGKLTIQHGDIRNLGMPGMTMVFRVQNPAMLDKVQEGDKVRFTADMVNGALTVSAIETVR